MSDPIRLWTFYNPNDGPMVVDLNGCMFRCEDAKVSSVEPTDRDGLPFPKSNFFVPQIYDVTCTFKLRTPSWRSPDDIYWETQLHPGHYVIL